MLTKGRRKRPWNIFTMSVMTWGGCGRWAEWGIPLGELLLFGVEDEKVKNRYRGFIVKMWSNREEILKMSEGQPAWCGEENITPCCLCVVHRLETVKQQTADWRAEGKGEELRRKEFKRPSAVTKAILVEENLNVNINTTFYTLCIYQQKNT